MPKNIPITSKPGEITFGLERKTEELVAKERPDAVCEFWEIVKDCKPMFWYATP